MILFGANFSLYYLILLGNIRTALRNEELRWFLGIIAFAVLTIAVDIRNLYGASAMLCAIRSSSHIDHLYDRLCHRGLQSLAGILQVPARAADVCRRLRRQHAGGLKSRA